MIRALSSLSNVLEQGDNIKSQTATSTYYADYGVWFPEFIMNPNEGYMLNTSQSGILVYPEGDNGIVSFSSAAAAYNESFFNENDFNYRNYEYNGHITSIINIDDKYHTNKNDELIIYSNDNECRGRAKALYCPLNDTYIFNIMVYSNLEEEDKLSFAYFDYDNNQMHYNIEEFNFTSNMFEGDALDPVELNIYNEISIIPDNYKLHQNYPNPFNPTTNIIIEVPTSDYIQVLIYDVNGRLVETLFNGLIDKGVHEYTWSPKNLSSGIYLVNLITSSESMMQKITLLK